MIGGLVLHCTYLLHHSSIKCYNLYLLGHIHCTSIVPGWWSIACILNSLLVMFHHPKCLTFNVPGFVGEVVIDGWAQIIQTILALTFRSSTSIFGSLREHCGGLSILMALEALQASMIRDKC